MPDVLTPPPGARVIETPGARMWLEDGIVHQAAIAARIELEHVQAIAAGVRTLIGPGERALVVADLVGVRALTSEARAYAASEERVDLIIAHAFVVRSPVSRVIAGFFVRVFQPPFPVRLVRDPASARAWLRDFRPAATA